MNSFCYLKGNNSFTSYVIYEGLNIDCFLDKWYNSNNQEEYLNNALYDEGL